MKLSDYDVSENQFWLAIWGGIGIIVIVIALLINGNVRYEAQMEKELLEKGFVKSTQTQCFQSKEVEVWLSPNGEIVD